MFCPVFGDDHTIRKEVYRTGCRLDRTRPAVRPYSEVSTFLWSSTVLVAMDTTQHMNTSCAQTY